MNKLGMKLRDTITGYAGIATCYIESPYNMPRYGLQPAIKDDGTLPDAYTFDDSDLEILEAGKVFIEPKVINSFQKTFNFGDKVTDTLSKFTGKIVNKKTFLSGCVHYMVVSEGTDGKFGQDVDFSSGRLELVKPAKTELSSGRGGGPLEKMARITT